MATAAEALGGGVPQRAATPSSSVRPTASPASANGGSGSGGAGGSGGSSAGASPSEAGATANTGTSGNIAPSVASGTGSRPTSPPLVRQSTPGPGAAGNAALRRGDPVSGGGGGSSGGRGGRPIVSAATAAEALTDRATENLIRRVLCRSSNNGSGGGVGSSTSAPPPPVQELLPPLTSRNDVDLQLYAFLSIVLREFVQSWYGKITTDDEFVAEIVRIVAHCTRALEQRLRKVDLESLLLDELPELLERHVKAYRVTHSSNVRPPSQADPREAYHSLAPLPALSPVPKSSLPGSVEEQRDNEAAYRQLLVQGALALLLPTEDLENECLTSLVGQIFSELIIGGVVANRVSEPWLIWAGLTTLAEVLRKRGRGRAAPATTAAGDVEKALDTLGRRHRQTKRHDDHLLKPDSMVHRYFWAAVRWLFLAITTIRVLVTTLVFSRSLSSRQRYSSIGGKEDVTGHDHGWHPIAPADLHETQPSQTKAPILAFRIWSCISTVIELDVRMPWLGGAMSLAQWTLINGPGRIASLDGILDRLLSHTIQTRVLDASQLPPLLRTLRGALFPNNAPGAPAMVPPASEEELLALRKRCAKAVSALVPARVQALYSGGGPSGRGPTASRPGHGSWRTGPTTSTNTNTNTNTISAAAMAGAATTTATSTPVGHHPSTTTTTGLPSTSSPRRRQDVVATPSPMAPGGGGLTGRGDEDEQQRFVSEIESGILDVFSDAYCNKHLMYGALELILVRLMPELAEKGVVELWKERLS